MQDLAQQGGSKLLGYVLDLRNDPGGKFDAAVQVADDFLDKGDIAIVKGRTADTTKHIAATPGDITNGLPMVALVNGGTASEAELVAGALQDDHRAVLVGTKTFGLSAIATLIPLNGNGAIKLTTARFQTPSGRPIQGKGLDPDVVVAPVKLEKIAQGFGRFEADLPELPLKNTRTRSRQPMRRRRHPAPTPPIRPRNRARRLRRLRRPKHRPNRPRSTIPARQLPLAISAARRTSSSPRHSTCCAAWPWSPPATGSSVTNERLPWA